jgi:hypothetical protein
MASSNSASDMNAILNPYLFQVIGSTPASIRDSIKTSALKANPGPGLRIAALCVFAAAVNKPTMENFVAKPEMADARPIVNTTFSISGKSNMTGLTLLGHCLLTTKFVDSITFCAEYRKKMGQQHIWDGDLDKGSISDKQKGILKEKKRVTPEQSAKLLGSGYFKYVGIDMTNYTDEESEFWGETNTRTAPATSAPSRPRPVPFVPRASTPPAASRPFVPSPPRSEQKKAMFEITLANGTVASVPKDVADYYLAIRNGDLNAMANSIANNGVETFVANYTQAMLKDPGKKGFSGTTVGPG